MTAMVTGSAGVGTVGMFAADEDVDARDGAGEGWDAGAAATAASSASGGSAMGGGAR